MFFRVLDFKVLQLFEAVEACASLRELQQLEPVAPGGHRELYLLEEPLFRQQRDDDFAGEPAGELFADVRYGPREHLFFVGSRSDGELYREAVHHRAVRDLHVVAVGRAVRLVHQEREDVHPPQGGAYDDRFAFIVLQQHQAVFEVCRRLEVQLRRGLRHLPVQELACGAQVAPQRLLYPFDACGVILGALPAGARPLAVADVVLQAYAVFAPGYRFGREVQGTGAELVDAVNEVEHVFLHHHRRVRTEILRTVPHQPPGGHHTGEGLVAHHYPGIGLVVLEHRVVARLQGLDKRVFEQQRILFRGNVDVPQGGYLPYHHPDFRSVFARLHEVGRNALLQILGLADINYLSGTVEELIDAGSRGEQGNLFLYG